MQNQQEILILTPVFQPEIGGIETHLTDLCKVLSRAGDTHAIVATFQPIFTVKRNDAPPRERIGCFDVIRFKWVLPGVFDRICKRSSLLAEIYLMPYYFLRSLGVMLRYRRRIQVIHAQGLMAAFCGRIFSILFKKPLIVSTHSFYNLTAPTLTIRIIRRILRGAFRILSLSEQSRAEVLAIGVPPEKAEVYRYWIDEERFQPAPRTEARRAMNLKDQFTILFSGRFLEVKGVPIILDILERLPPDATLVFVGGGPLESEIRRRIAGNPNAILMPIIPNDRITQLYSASDVLIVPSTWQEGLGRVILEAMTCGLPVIGSNRGGIPEVINSTTGILIEPNPEELLAAIIALKGDEARRRNLGTAARAYSLEHFSSRNAEVIRRAYRDALAVVRS